MASVYDAGMYLSQQARQFISRWGSFPGAQDDYGRDVISYLADRGWQGKDRKNLICLDSLLRNGYQTDAAEDICQSALKDAVDMGVWAMADVLLRFPICREHLLEALQNLMSQMLCFGDSRFGTRKTHEYALKLMQRLGGLSPEECQRLIDSAADGAAFSFLLPLMLNGATPPALHMWEDIPLSPFERLQQQFLSERLPRLLEQHRHHFPDFPVIDGKLRFTGNPAARLPLLSIRRPREKMKDLERAALLFAVHTHGVQA